MKLFDKVKQLLGNHFLVFLFVYISITNAAYLLIQFPKLVVLARGGTLYQLGLAVAITGLVHVVRSNINLIKDVGRRFWANFGPYFVFAKSLILKLVAAGFVAALFFFLLSNKNKSESTQRSLTINFSEDLRVTYTASAELLEIQNIFYIDSLKKENPWELFYHTRSGYTALESSEMMPGKRSVTFNINTPSPFTKLRLDPGGQKVIQHINIDQLILKEEGQLVRAYEGAELADLITPLQQTVGTYDPNTEVYQATSNDLGDPQFELAIQDLEFEPERVNFLRNLKIAAVCLFLLIFFLLFYQQQILAVLSQKQQGNLILAGTKVLAGLVVGLLFFSFLSDRGDFVSLKFIHVELEKDMDIPQDPWRIYLNIEGYKERHSSLGLKFGKHIFLPIWTSRDFSDIRIDPGVSAQAYLIKKISFIKGIETISELSTQEAFRKIIPVNDFKDFTYNKQADNIRLVTDNGGDPFVVLKMSSNDFEDRSNFFEWSMAVVLAILVALILLFWQRLRATQFSGKIWLATGLLLNFCLLAFTFYLLGEIKYITLLATGLWLFVLPGLLIKDVLNFETGSLVSSLIVSFALGISFIMLPFFCFYAFNIPNMDIVPKYMAISMGGLFLLKLLLKPKQRLAPYIASKFTAKNLLEISIFNFLLFFFLVPISGLECGPLHDPSVTSILAQKVLDGNFVKEVTTAGSYPPYLHLSTALLSKISGLATPKIVLFLTNFITILTGLAFAFFWEKVFKNAWSFPISIMLVMFLSPSIPNFYFVSGKNAMVISLFFWFIIFLLSKQVFESNKNPSFLKGFAFTLVMITGFLFHYTTALTFPAIVSFFFMNLYNDFKAKGKWALVRYLKFGFSFLIPSLFFLSIFYLQEKSIVKLSAHKVDATAPMVATPTNPAAESNAPNTSETAENIKLTIPETPLFTKVSKLAAKMYQKTDEGITLSILKIKGAIGLLPHYLKDYSTKESIFKLEKLTYVSSWILLFLFFFSKYRREVIIIFTFSVIIYIMAYSPIFNIALYGKTLRFFLSILVGGLFLNLLFEHIRKYWILSFIVIAWLGVQLAKSVPMLYFEYFNARQYSVLTKADLEAYDYMSEHLADKGYFIPINASDLIFKNTIPYDGSMYMNLSKAQAATSFSEPQKIENLSSLEIASLRISLATWIGADDKAKVVFDKMVEKHPHFKMKELPEKMKELNVRYLYSGAHSAWNRLVTISRLEQDGCFKRIYSKNGVDIYEVVDEDEEML